jgi:hypothetical protein
MKQSRTQLKNWYKKGLKPLEGQFADWIDSYWHIDDQIPFSSVSGLPDLTIYEVKASKGLANGYASLDATGKVPLSQLPSGIGGAINAGTVNQIAVYNGVNSISSTPNITIINSTPSVSGALTIKPNSYVNGNLETVINITGQDIPNNVTGGSSTAGAVNITGGANSSISQIFVGGVNISGGGSVTRAGSVTITGGNSSGATINAKGGSINLNPGTGAAGNGILNLGGKININATPTTRSSGDFLFRENGGDLSKYSVSETSNLFDISVYNNERIFGTGDDFDLIITRNSTPVGTFNTNGLSLVGKLSASSFQLGTSSTLGWVLTTDASGNGTWQPPKSSGANFSKYVPTTVANTTAETSILGTGSGTATIAANELVLGKRYRVMFITYSSTANATSRSVNIRLKIGGVLIANMPVNFGLLLSNSFNRFTIDVVCTATGTNGSVFQEIVLDSYFGGVTNQASATTTINTTIANTIDITAQWSDAVAGNSVVCNSLSIVPLN